MILSSLNMVVQSKFGLLRMFVLVIFFHYTFLPWLTWLTLLAWFFFSGIYTCFIFLVEFLLCTICILCLISHSSALTTLVNGKKISESFKQNPEKTASDIKLYVQLSLCITDMNIRESDIHVTPKLLGEGAHGAVYKGIEFIIIPYQIRIVQTQHVHRHQICEKSERRISQRPAS